MTRRAYIWTHDIAGDQSGVIGRDFRELYIDTTLDQTETLNFAIPANHPKAYLLAEDLLLRYNGRQFYVKHLTQERNGTETLVRVEAPALWYRLGEIEVPGSVVIDDDNPSHGLGHILEESGWTVGGASVGTGSFSMEAQDKSLLALVRTWAKITGTHASFDTLAKTVTLSASRGRNIGLAFRKGRNLRNVKRRRTPPKVTQVYPYGRDDLTISGVNSGVPYLEDLSFYTAQGISEADARSLYTKRRVLRDTSFVKEAELLAWAQDRVATEAQSIQAVELDVVDIAEITGVAEDLEVGDNTRAYDPDFDEEFSATVTRTRIYPLAPARNEVELSTSPPVISDPSQTTNPQRSQEWIQFPGPIRADYQIRNDGDYIVARIPLRFSEGGRADFHLDLWAEGVGDGDMIVTVIDTADSNAQQFKQITVPYTDGATCRAQLSWATENLSGSKVFAVRVTTVADGGPSDSNGVDITADTGATSDLADEYEASWWIKAQGAVQETPTAPNSVRFDYVSDAAQSWTVPDNITEVTFEVVGAGGAGGAGGGSVTFTAAVIPGTEYDIYAPSAGENAAAGWPGGGAGGDVSGINDGGGGGGYAAVIPTGGSLSSAIAVAGAGGGFGQGGRSGGVGGFLAGGDGDDSTGSGATQSAGGTGIDTGNDSGENGSFGQGGAGENGSAFDEGGGGGGGGWYGGGGGGSTGSYGTGGGGGSGYLDTSLGAYNITTEDGANTDDGYVEISWETPAI